MPRTVRLAVACLLGALFAGAGCATELRVPPRVDLGAWRTIGLLEFSESSEPELGQFATRQFLQMLHAAQPGVRILELGSERYVLAEVDREELDFETVRAIGDQFEVDALFVGDLELGRMKPRVRFGQTLTSMEARADVNGQLAAKLLETDSGVTLWSRTSTASANVAHVGVPEDGGPSFGVTGPSDVRAGLVRQLVTNLSYDFYPHWEKQ